MHPHFEAVKVALKQDKTGYILTLNIHPDDLDERILRDFVGARYQVVMVRIDQDEKPMNRDKEYSGDKSVKLAGLLCRDPKFWDYLHDDNQIIDPTEKEATSWLRDYLGVKSRTELKVNHDARKRLENINTEFNKWKIAI